MIAANIFMLYDLVHDSVHDLVHDSLHDLVHDSAQRWRRRTTIVMVKSPSIVMDYGTMDIACFPIHVSFMKLTLTFHCPLG